VTAAIVISLLVAGGCGGEEGGEGIPPGDASGSGADPCEVTLVEGVGRALPESALHDPVADIGFHTVRQRVLIPTLSENRLEIRSLPPG